MSIVPEKPKTGSPEWAARWRWIALPAGIAIASRVFSVLLIAVADRLNAVPHPNPFVIWDARWYLSIAERGYHSTSIQATASGAGRLDIAFFPAWPSLIRLSTLGFLPDGVTSVVLANLLFILAAVLLWRMLADRLDPRVATGAIALLAFSPPAYVFSMAYSESLFLVIAALYFLSRASSLWRGPLAGLAILTRIAGAALVVSAAVQVVRTHGPERRAAVVGVIGGVVGFAAWWVFLAFVMHDPLGFMKGSPSWAPHPGFVVIASAIHHPTVRGIAWLSFVAVMFVGAALVARRDRELGIYALAALALAVLPGGVLNSMPRYALAAFPAFAGLAGRLGRRGTIVLLVIFVIGQCVLARWAVTLPKGNAP